MAAGDVAVTICDCTEAAIDTAMTALRTTGGANGKYMIAITQNGQKAVCVGITEA